MLSVHPEPEHGTAMDQKNRLERMITRLSAQRNCLAHALDLIAALHGPLFEFGLGKGRTYDFLRSRAGGRRIVAFDREIHCPPDCVPAAKDLLLGDFHDTVPGALARIGETAALAHFDVGSEDLAADAVLVAWLSVAAAPLVKAGGVVVSDRPMAIARWRALPALPEGSDDGHFLYRVQP